MFLHMLGKIRGSDNIIFKAVAQPRYFYMGKKKSKNKHALKLSEKVHPEVMALLLSRLPLADAQLWKLLPTSASLPGMAELVN